MTRLWQHLRVGHHGLGWIMRPDSTRRAVAVLLSLTLVAVVAGAWFAVAHHGLDFEGAVPEPVGAFAWLQCSSALLWSAAAVVLLRRPEIGWTLLCAVAALSHAVAAAAYGWAVHSIAVEPGVAGADVAVWVVGWSLPVEVVALSWMVVTAPDGRFPAGRLRWPALYSVAGPMLGVVAIALASLDVEGSGFEGRANPLGGGLVIPQLLPLLLIAPTAITSLWVVWVRWRRAVGATRTAMRAVVVITVVGVFVPFLVAADSATGVFAAQVVGALQLLALVAVVLRHRMFGIDSWVERAVAYTLLTALLLVLYVGLAVLTEQLFGSNLPAVVAVVVALLALPLRDVLRRATTQFVFGDRDRPQDVMEAVARRAATAGIPEEMLSGSLEEIRSRLRLGGLLVTSADGVAELARSGEVPRSTLSPGGATEGAEIRVDLVHRSQHVGILVAAPRRGEDRLDALDREALERLAPQLAAAVDAAGITAALRASRDRLVKVREEERRRLRRDLHDGLGPGLTGIALTIDAARNIVGSDPERADALLASARSELTEALGEVRRVVDGLRPPALDDLGLAASVRQHADRFPGLAVSVSDDGSLAQLSAATEVAAYRIATEALTNAARHAHASRATVEFRTNGQFEVEITDDGTGCEAWVPGVGISSMGERVAEVGGSLTAGPAMGGGGQVLARFPVER